MSRVAPRSCATGELAAREALLAAPTFAAVAPVSLLAAEVAAAPTLSSTCAALARAACTT